MELILQLLFSRRKLFVGSLQLLVAELQLELVLLAFFNVHPDQYEDILRLRVHPLNKGSPEGEVPRFR
ncbi:hypothetical protein D3C73_1479710 [compost metagenome]